MTKIEYNLNVKPILVEHFGAKYKWNVRKIRNSLQGSITDISAWVSVLCLLWLWLLSSTKKKEFPIKFVQFACWFGRPNQSLYGGWGSPCYAIWCQNDLKKKKRRQSRYLFGTTFRSGHIYMCCRSDGLQIFMFWLEMACNVMWASLSCVSDLIRRRETWVKYPRQELFVAVLGCQGMLDEDYWSATPPKTISSLGSCKRLLRDGFKAVFIVVLHWRPPEK